MMLEGVCPKCGAIYRGCNLKSSWFQTCDRCGSEIDIKESPLEIIIACSNLNLDKRMIHLTHNGPFSDNPQTKIR
jgi:hypothetical protein